MGRTGATGLGDGSRGRLDPEVGGGVVCTIIRYMYLCSKISGGLDLYFYVWGWDGVSSVVN